MGADRDPVKPPRAKATPAVPVSKGVPILEGRVLRPNPTRGITAGMSPRKELPPKPPTPPSIPRPNPSVPEKRSDPRPPRTK